MSSDGNSWLAGTALLQPPSIVAGEEMKECFLERGVHVWFVVLAQRVTTARAVVHTSFERAREARLGGAGGRRGREGEGEERKEKELMLHSSCG